MIDSKANLIVNLSLEQAKFVVSYMVSFLLFKLFGILIKIGFEAVLSNHSVVFIISKL
jgi:hypothetical protein